MAEKTALELHGGRIVRILPTGESARSLALRTLPMPNYLPPLKGDLRNVEGITASGDDNRQGAFYVRASFQATGPGLNWNLGLPD